MLSLVLQTHATFFLFYAEASMGKKSLLKKTQQTTNCVNSTACFACEPFTTFLDHAWEGSWDACGFRGSLLCGSEVLWALWA